VEAGSEPVFIAVVPTWRRDLAVEADVAEEVARVRGYETTPGHLPDTVMPAYRPSMLGVRDAVRETLAGAGLTEVVTHALVSPPDEAWLRWPEDVSDPALPADLATKPGDPITVTNPLSANHSVLRRNVTGSLLDVLSRNERQGRLDVAVFEIGKTYARVGGKPMEWTRLALLLAGAAEPPAWNRPRRQYDLDDAKGLVEAICRRLHLPAPVCTADARGFPFHPGRALLAVSGSGRRSLSGRVAEIHPDVTQRLDLRAGRVIVAELAIAGLDGEVAPPIHVEAIPRFPEVERDLAVIVAENRPAAEIEACITRHGGRLLRRVAVFDLYRGSPLAADEKSLAYRLVFGAADRTLTEEEVESVSQAVQKGLAADLGARLRA
jgi:phenylalanyl-tRNA synthetase beta chain